MSEFASQEKVDIILDMWDYNPAGPQRDFVTVLRGAEGTLRLGPNDFAALLNDSTFDNDRSRHVLVEMNMWMDELEDGQCVDWTLEDIQKLIDHAEVDAK